MSTMTVLGYLCILTVWSWAFIPATASAARASGTRPNILLILADDLGYSDLGCYGGEIPTPNLDRIAHGGVRFSDFYNSARCCPSRASLITGLHPHQAGVGDMTTGKPDLARGPAYAGHLLPNCNTVAEMLAGAGYSTWMVGKWHLGSPGPIARGFQNYYGFRNFVSHSETQWDPSKYERLPPGTRPELAFPDGGFYATDVFTDYALEFLKQARQQKSGSTAKPWFLYLAHSSPHFPIHAPKSSIETFMPMYRRGWDALRVERFGRMKKLGLIPGSAALPPRELVPVDRADIANGFPGLQNPAWDSLPDDRREDLARRMATFAAMVEHIDKGVGRLLEDLKQNGELAKTIILFLSDNGACYEWGPFGFDGESRQGKTTLHTGAELEKIGQRDSFQSYGSAWANLGNTPLKLYKHFCHEGGISSPLIVHWPAGFTRRGDWIADPAHIMDITPTLLDAAGISQPTERNAQPVNRIEGISLLPALEGRKLPERSLAFEHQEARALRRGDWKAVWGKRMPTKPAWELYNLKADRSEVHDLARQYPDRVAKLGAEWQVWAQRVKVHPFYIPTGATNTPSGP